MNLMLLASILIATVGISNTLDGATQPRRGRIPAWQSSGSPLLTKGFEWKSVNELQLPTGTLKVGQYEKMFQKALGRNDINYIELRGFPNYVYASGLGTEPFTRWESCVIGKIDFEYFYGSHAADYRNKVLSIRVKVPSKR